MLSLVILKEMYNAIPFSSVLQLKGLELISDGDAHIPLFTRSRVVFCEWLMEDKTV